jgi:hypothetical protein
VQIFRTEDDGPNNKMAYYNFIVRSASDVEEGYISQTTIWKEKKSK